MRSCVPDPITRRSGGTGKWPSIINEVRAKHRQQQEPSLCSSAALKGDYKPHCLHVNNKTNWQLKGVTSEISPLLAMA